MSIFKSEQQKQKLDLNIERNIKELIDMKMKAEKVFAMHSVSDPRTKYVLSALQYAIDVAQGKRPASLEARAAEANAVKVAGGDVAQKYQNKFATMRAAARGLADKDKPGMGDDKQHSVKLGG